MTKLFSMPFMVDRYRRKTLTLSLEEHGAYLILLCAMWENKGTLPASDEAISVALGRGMETWLRLKPRLWHYFTVYGEGDNATLTQDTLQEQWNKAQANSERQKVKGKRGGDTRWEKARLLKTLSHGHSPGNGTSNSRAIPILSNSINPDRSRKDMEGAASESDELPDIPSALDRRGSLAARLDTPLMKLHSRGHSRG